MTYEVREIKPSTGPSIHITTPVMMHWKEKNNLYHLIQKHCTHPAYFWFNYKWSIPDPVTHERVLMTTPEAIEKGWQFEILRELHLGTVSPQDWCDRN